jgi:cytoskeleton protein RodZ
MDTPGSILRTEREKQNISLKEIADSLKLNIEYLKAIENGEYHLIPAEIYTKAYLRFYARALGLDEEFITGLYQKQVNASSAKKPLPADNRTGNFSRAVFIVTALAVAALTLVILTRHEEPPVETVQETKGPEVSETAGSKTDVESADTKESATPRELATTNEPLTQKEAAPPKQQATATTGEHNGLSLEIIATDTTWVAVGIDGGKIEEWLLKSGEEISLSAAEKFAVKIGNAAGTRVFFNNEDMGELGQQGEVVELVLPKKKE